MKTILRIILPLVAVVCFTQLAGAQVNNPGTVAQNDATNQANNNINNTVNNGVTGVANGIKGLFKKKAKPDTSKQVNQAAVVTGQPAGGAGAPGTPAARLASYQNYDFIPGNKILFEDEFTDDQSGEFPTHWNLTSGQAILNMQGADKAFFMTDGNYCRVFPLMKNDSYLTSNFSVEYDVFPGGGYGLGLEIDDADKSGNMTIQVGNGDVTWAGYVGATDKSTSLTANLPADIAEQNQFNKWHHIAIAYKNDQLKVYVDKYRVLIVPHCNGLAPSNLQFYGIGSQDKPIIFKNVKIADGAQMYMTGQTFTDAKIVTHGINFDVDKATIKPESMGTLNMIVQVMKSNPALKFEVDGHTDNTGTAAHNQILSQQRADAVRAELIVLGIDGSRLTTKGFGDTVPIADNSTLDGKANNRRVEFVKM